MSGSLLTAENAADSLYGFPSGTMAALGASESSQGANLGTIGNIFQVTPATAAQPGYGLPPINGNDPVSVGSYLAKLVGLEGGDVASALADYQGYSTSGTPPNAAMQGFLSALPAGGGYGAYATGGGSTGGSGSGAPGSTAATATPASGASGGGTAGCSWTSPACWFSTAGSALAPFATRGALILVAIVLLAGAVYLFAQRTQSVTETA